MKTKLLAVLFAVPAVALALSPPPTTMRKPWTTTTTTMRPPPLSPPDRPSAPSSPAATQPIPVASDPSPMLSPELVIMPGSVIKDVWNRYFHFDDYDYSDIPGFFSHRAPCPDWDYWYDGVAALIAVYLEGIDYVAVPRGRESAKPGHNEVYLSRLDAMAARYEVLHDSAPDAEIHLVVLASHNTLSSMRSVWGEELERKGFELVEYRDLMNYLRKLSSSSEVAGKEWPPQFEQLLDDAYSSYRKGDFDTSFPLFLMLSDKGFDKAYAYVGLAYERGQGVEKDEEKAIAYYQKAVEARRHLGADCLTRLYDYRGKRELTFAVLSRAVEEGFATHEDYLELASMLERGDGVPQNLQNAIEYYRIAVSLASSRPFGVAYERDKLEWLEAQDFKKVRLSEVTQGFDAERLYSLGMEHRMRNVPRALAYLRLAADKGHALAASELSVLFSSQAYPIYSEDEARKYARLASDGLMALAIRNPRHAAAAGDAYAQGRGCERDENKAVLCYKAGVREKNWDCAVSLAIIYWHNGKLEEAFQLFLDAANGGSEIAKLKVAECFQNGIGTPRDVAKAIDWYEQVSHCVFHFDGGKTVDVQRRLEELRQEESGSTDGD